MLPKTKVTACQRVSGTSSGLRFLSKVMVSCEKAEMKPNRQCWGLS